ncbi:hypothetical protein EVAR_63481_1 [Eumeta japonica]|uniref:Uncharacterized protein n=1 Tax=Eumeta variegata TaxID=151549 RepID=A0A4C2A751_EUMVA|nr:hypothetical protein EVAR_63481_1 [Eumeta japonica]
MPALFQVPISGYNASSVPGCDFGDNASSVLSSDLGYDASFVVPISGYNASSVPGCDFGDNASSVLSSDLGYDASFVVPILAYNASSVPGCDFGDNASSVLGSDLGLQCELCCGIFSFKKVSARAGVELRDLVVEIGIDRIENAIGERFAQTGSGNCISDLLRPPGAAPLLSLHSVEGGNGCRNSPQTEIACFAPSNVRSSPEEAPVRWGLLYTAGVLSDYPEREPKIV